MAKHARDAPERLRPHRTRDRASRARAFDGMALQAVHRRDHPYRQQGGHRADDRPACAHRLGPHIAPPGLLLHDNRRDYPQVERTATQPILEALFQAPLRRKRTPLWRYHLAPFQGHRLRIERRRGHYSADGRHGNPAHWRVPAHALLRCLARLGARHLHPARHHPRKIRGKAPPPHDPRHP